MQAKRSQEEATPSSSVIYDNFRLTVLICPAYKIFPFASNVPETYVL